MRQPGIKSYVAHLGPSGNDQLLCHHLHQVSKTCMRLSGKVGLARAGELIGLMHDIGKYSDAFQQYLRSSANDAQMEMEPTLFVKGKIDHSTAGAQLIWKHLVQQNAQFQQSAEFLALCVASHHSGLIDCLKPDGTDDLTRRLNKAEADSHCEEAWEAAEPAIRERANALLADP